MTARTVYVTELAGRSVAIPIAPQAGHKGITGDL